MTGSIGVYGLLLDIEGLSEKIGVTFDSVNVGEHINPFTIARPKNEEELAFVQEMVDDIYEAFITNVAGHRDMERDQVHAIAQGRVWSGAQAVKHGLVDEIGGLEYAIETAADLAGLDEYGIEHHPKEMTSIEVIAELLGEDLAKARTRSSAETRLHYLRRQIESLRVWNDRRNIYTLLPLQLH